MITQPTARVPRHWRALALLLLALTPRLYLLRGYDIELSQDGFDAVSTLAAFQAHGTAALSNEQITRFVLHPFYTLVLFLWRILTPAPFDFYLSARLLSTLGALIAITILFALVRRAYNEPSAWIAALFLSFAPTFLWESVAILSSTIFLALYLGVLFALVAARYRLAAFLALLSALTRLEGVVLLALVFLALGWRDARVRRFNRADWSVWIACALAAPLAIMGSSWLVSGNALQFLQAQSIATIWLRFFAPGDFWKRGAFFVTNYAALVPAPIVWLGIAGALIALWRYRHRATILLLLTSALYLVFFETLVWLNYTTLETRFLMYPGLPLLVFAGIAIQWFQVSGFKVSKFNLKPETLKLGTGFLTALLALLSFQQGDAGIRFIYNSYATQREVVEELAQIVPAHQPTNVMVYGGIAGALDYYARQRDLQLAFTYFRFAPDDNPEQFLIERKIQFLIYPIGNAFAKAKYPYLAQFETQTRGGVTFQPLTQFATTLDGQLYGIWAVKYQ